MVNPRIAPMAELDIDERIAEIEKFLEEQEKKAGITPTKTIPKPLETQAPFEGTYRSKSGLFRGTTEGEVALSPMTLVSNEEMLTVLKKISENQEIERKRYERNNPVEGDEPIYDWAEATIDPGQMVQFIYTVPEGHAFYFEYLNITHEVDTTYYIWIDGSYQPTLSQTLQDFGDHEQIYKPPKMAYNTVQVWALNSWVAPQTYSCFFRGFNRWYRAIKREITYESLIKEKLQET